MNNRENTMAILNYQKYDRMPIVYFGYWNELLWQWQKQGHISEEECKGYRDGNNFDDIIAKKLGFDYCWTNYYGSNNNLNPHFQYKVIEERADGFVRYINGNGLIEEKRTGAGSIPASIGTLMTGREAWEELYLPKLQKDSGRCGSIDKIRAAAESSKTYNARPVGLHTGSLYGSIRDMLGVEELSYLYTDDEDLYIEIIDTIACICYDNAKTILSAGFKPDFFHYWEDICFKNGPLVNPELFKKYVGPHYKKINDLGKEYGVNIVSLDCDGCIDKLLPIWLENGVNTMFPIEVGTWEASIEPWKKQYGKELRGVGGMDKRVFELDRAAVDTEVDKQRRLIDLGGYIPCPDHRIQMGASWDLVRYYCDKMNDTLNK